MEDVRDKMKTKEPSTSFIALPSGPASNILWPCSSDTHSPISHKAALTLRTGLNSVPQSSCPPKPPNVTLFGNGFSGDAISYDAVTLD